MYISARNSFGPWKDGWIKYLSFIGIPNLTEVRTIDPGLNDFVKNSKAEIIIVDDIDKVIRKMPPLIGPAQYYQLAINLSSESSLLLGDNYPMLGYDISDGTWTSSLLNCGEWTGDIKAFTARLNNYGLLSLSDAKQIQSILPKIWDGDEHGYVDIWELHEIIVR